MMRLITSKNFQIQILDGRTGKIKKSAATPVSDEDNETLIGVPYNQYALIELTQMEFVFAILEVWKGRVIF